jgi:hypothetical protein
MFRTYTVLNYMLMPFNYLITFAGNGMVLLCSGVSDASLNGGTKNAIWEIFGWNHISLLRNQLNE